MVNKTDTFYLLRLIDECKSVLVEFQDHMDTVPTLGMQKLISRIRWLQKIVRKIEQEREDHED